MTNASNYFSVDDPVLENDYAKNGDFELWQEHVSLLLPDASRHYVADFWGSQRLTQVTTVSRQNFALGQPDVPGNARYYLNFNSSGAEASAHDAAFNVIEDVRLLNGEQCVASIWLKANAAKTLTAELRQNFGSGGSATVIGLSAVFNVNTFWQQFTLQGLLPSILGATLGGDAHIEFALVENTAFSAFSLDVAQFRLGQGKVPLTHVYKTFEEKLAIAQREYEKSYDLGIFAGAISDNGAVGVEATGTAIAEHHGFVVSKRGNPVVNIYNPKTGAVGSISDQATSANPKVGSAIHIGDNGFNMNGISVIPENSYYYHFIADSRVSI